MLTDEQKLLFEIVQEMSPLEITDLIAFARSLVRKRSEPATPLYDADDLTDADLDAIAADSLRRFAEDHPDDHDYSDTWSAEDIEDWRRSGLDHMERVCPHDDPSGETGDTQPQ
jgi:hypothetical protein